MIVCMGLLVTVLSVGVVRLRAAHNRSHADEVNPLEVERQLLSCNFQFMCHQLLSVPGI